MEDVLLQLSDLSISYQSDGKKVCAVNHVSFRIQKGETLGLVGETGAGKTTIARAILDILPHPQSRVDGGEIFFDGQDLFKLSEHDKRKIKGNKISMIFQDPMTALNPVQTIGRQIAETIELHEKLSKKDVEKRAVEMLEQVGITPDRYGDYPHQLSGGMKQRVVIAMALACHPQLLLADEPTTALDVTIQAQILELMNQLKEHYGTAVLMITHDLGIIAETCQNVAVIYAGEIVEYGTVEQIFNEPLHPYTKGLFGSIIDLEKDVERLSPIEGMTPDPTDLPIGCKFNPRCPGCTELCTGSAPELKDLGAGHLCRCFHARKGVE